MSCIDGKEFAFDIRLEIIHPSQALDLRLCTDHTRAVNIPLGKRLDLDEQRILVVLNRNDAVNGSVREADTAFSFCLQIIGKMLIDEVPQHR